MKYLAGSLLVALSLGGAAGADVLAVHDDGTWTRGGPMVGPLVMGPGFTERGNTLVYDSSTQTGFRANGGSAGFLVGAPADPLRMLLDDVPIPAAILNGATSLDVCRITVGIRRLVNAPATDVNVFFTTLTTGPIAPDTEVDTPPTLVGTVSLPAAAVSVTELVTFGVSGGPTLFNAPLNDTLLAGFGTFGVGVTLSSTDGLNGWRLTSGPSANANVFWLYDPAHSGQPNDEGAYLFSNANPPNPAATFYIVVEGNPIPAPGCLALMGLAGLAAIRRRR